MMELWWAYLLLGGAVGFFAGLLGVGGGGIMVPVLTSIFIATGVAPGQQVHLALATSMAAIIVTSFASARSHHRHQAVLWPVVWRMSPGIVAGTLLAALLTSFLSSYYLALFFCIFMAYVALQLLLNIKPKASRTLPGTAALVGTGFGIGGISALVAIGGGSLTVPFLTWCNVKMQQAIGTSAALGLPIAISGTLGYALSGWLSSAGHASASDTVLPWGCVGYVYLPAVLLISVVSAVTAPLGVQLAQRLPVSTLKKIFALLLVSLSAKMLHSVLTAGL